MPLVSPPSSPPMFNVLVTILHGLPCPTKRGSTGGKRKSLKRAHRLERPNRTSLGSYNSGLDDEGFLGPIWSATAQTLRQMLQQHNQLPEVEGPFYLCRHPTSLTRYMNRFGAIIRRCILLTSDIIYILTGVSRLLLFTATVERVDHSDYGDGVGEFS